MSRILLADDSPHAQRMGERILREEGYEVASVTDGGTALLRLEDVDPDLILVDAFLPAKSGFDICRYVKSHPRHKHIRVILTAGLLEPLDEEEARRAGGDAIIKKPFEASAMLAAIKPLITEAQLGRDLYARERAAAGPAPPLAAARAPIAAPQPALAAPAAEPVPVVEPERIRAAVTIALDAAMPALIDEITERVLIALGH